MKSRLFFILLVLITTGALFFLSNRASPLNGIENSLFLTSVFVGTITCLSLALGSLASIGIVICTRSAAIPIITVSAFSDIDTSLKVALIIFSSLHLTMFSQKLLSSFATDTGAEREDVFLLTTPISITIAITFSFVVSWSAIIQCINLIRNSNTIGALLLGILPLLFFAFFVPYALKIPLRRCVIVPHGIVIADYITLTDTVLLPLSKIKSIQLENKVDIKNLDSNNVYTNSLTKISNVINISLNEKTDSLILRRSVNESERINVEEIYLSLAQSKLFFSHFYKRFHKVEPEELTLAKERIIEKQLGIETAPRSDSPLPSWRNRKKNG